jgi:site-specific recombinase XerD
MNLSPNFSEIEELSTSAKEYAKKAYSSNTVRAYRSDWAQFAHWGEQNDLATLPSTPEVIGTYISFLADSGMAVSSIRRHLSTIHKAHDLGEMESPVKSGNVNAIMRGIAREHGSQQTRKKAITTQMVKAWIDLLPDHLPALRDKAVVLLGFSGALRRSEIVALNVDDVQFTNEGMVLKIASSKTDQDGEGELVAIPYGQNEEYCPVRTLRKWLMETDISAGPILRSFWKGGEKVRPGGMNARAVAEIAKEMAILLGLDPREYSGHSLRAGHATEAIRQGASERVAMNQGRWKSRNVFRRYVREGNLFRENSAATLGL